MGARTAPIVWSGPAFDASGFACELRDTVLALDRAGVAVHLDPWDRHWRTRVDDGTAERLERLLLLRAPDRFVHVVHGSPDRSYKHKRAVLSVARLMFETDGLPREHLAACERVDEVWVPAQFNVETFSRAGVSRDKLHVIPEGIDKARFEPRPAPAHVGLDGFVFLSVFGWGRRKAWDVLVRAFLEEFHADEPVKLLIKTTSLATGRRNVEEFVRALGHELDPRIRIVTTDPGDTGMPGLYAAASAFVLASHGEGWGRPLMEAMATGLPTIATRWGGNTAFMNDENSYLVDYDLVDVPGEALHEEPRFAGQRWAEPSLAHLRTTMRRVYEEPVEAAVRGARARERILEHFTQPRTAAAVLSRLQDAGISVERSHASSAPAHRVTLQGPVFTTFGMASVNRGLSRALIGTGRVDLELVADGGSPDTFPPVLSARARTRSPRPRDVWIRHGWPPDFSPPPSGKLVMASPWEWGWLPSDWNEPLQRVVDEVWVPSAHVRDTFVRSGVDADRVVIVPYGVDPLRFSRRVRPLELNTRKRFRFLFVGGTLWRKGADILLETYLETFGQSDDVCLVVRDLGADTFYAGQTLRETLRAQERRSDGPDVLYLDRDLDEVELRRLYAACDCLVHPYRAEGFALPIAEAMACGLPVIVPDRGACRDYCDETVAYLVPAAPQRGADARIARTIEPPEWVEVDRERLGDAMRHVVANPVEAAERGARARAHIVEKFSWNRSADVALERLDALARRHTRRRVPRPTLSVCMIVKNEESQLARALESVQPVADEIVVVDTGSEDGTVALAESFGARVCLFAFNDDLAEARNESLRLATGDWILAFDADHELEPSSRDELRSSIQTTAMRGYILRFFSTLPSGEPFETLDLRLFPNHPALRFEYPTHEQLVCTRPDLSFDRIVTSITVRHHGVRSEPAKNRWYAALLERTLRERADDVVAATYLGGAYKSLGELEKAEAAYAQAIASADGVVDSRIASSVAIAHAELGRLQLEFGRPSRARDNAARSLALDPEFFDARLVLATAQLHLGHAHAAVVEFARTARSRHGIPWGDAKPPLWRAYVGMAQALASLGDADAVREALDEAERDAPGHPVVVAARERLAAANF